MQEAVARDPRNSSLKAGLIRVEGEIDGVDAAVAKARALATGDPDKDIYDLVSAELYEKRDADPMRSPCSRRRLQQDHPMRVWRSLWPGSTTAREILPRLRVC